MVRVVITDVLKSRNALLNNVAQGLTTCFMHVDKHKFIGDDHLNLARIQLPITGNMIRYSE